MSGTLTTTTEINVALTAELRRVVAENARLYAINERLQSVIDCLKASHAEGQQALRDVSRSLTGVKDS